MLAALILNSYLGIVVAVLGKSIELADITTAWCLGVVNLAVDRLKRSAQKHQTTWSVAVVVFQSWLITGCIITTIAIFISIIQHICCVLLAIIASLLVFGIFENRNYSVSHAIASCLLL